jgi:hypothetical protein
MKTSSQTKPNTVRRGTDDWGRDYRSSQVRIYAYIVSCSGLIRLDLSALVFAGNDTTRYYKVQLDLGRGNWKFFNSSALARTFDLLAQYPDVQSRLREEVREAHGKHGKSLDYNQLNSLVFLDAVCRESLRLFPPAQRIQRVAVTDWNLPLQHPVKSKDGRSIISNLHVPKGTKIHLSIAAANRDKWVDTYVPSG